MFRGPVFFKLLVFFFAVNASFLFIQNNNANAQVCLPTCGNDARFLAFVGQDLVSNIQSNLNFGLGSSAISPELNFGLFDAEAGGFWDEGTGDGIEINLYADPLGDGSGNFKVGTWFSDGSGGLNAGMPMPDNAWFDITIANVPQARAESGNFLYRLEIINRDSGVSVINDFKLRTDESLFIFNEQPFAFNASLFANPAVFFDMLDIVYPDFVFAPPCFVDPFTGCDFNDPTCCFNSSIYDGTFDIYLLFEDDSIELNFWEADADFGTTTVAIGPPFEDTDDPNTPGAPFLPEWANPDTAIFQASNGSGPPDDQIFIIFLRPTNVTYNLISPLGDSYHNPNPTASNEWELFQLNTEPGCAPFTCDIQVDEIPQGIWTANFNNLDMANSVFLRLEGAVLGVDEENNPVLPLDPDPEIPVPTMSEWGMFATVIFFGLIGLFHLNRKRVYKEG